jgi:hypothetical protein
LVNNTVGSQNIAIFWLPTVLFTKAL